MTERAGEDMIDSVLSGYSVGSFILLEDLFGIV